MRKLVMISILTLLLGTMAQAAVQQGDTEITFGGAWSRYSAGNHMGIQGTAITTFNVQGSYGYFVNDNVQIALAAGYDQHSMGSTKLQFLGVGVTGKYHFLIDQPLVPYVGVEVMLNKGINLGQTAYNDRKDGASLGGIIGARYELDPKNDFFIEYVYRELYDDYTKSTFNLDNAQFLRFGLVHQFQ